MLLLQKKSRGRPIRLVASRSNIAKPLFQQPQPLTPYRERTRSVEAEIESFANSPVFVTVKPKSNRTTMEENKENFAVPRPKKPHNKTWDSVRPKSATVTTPMSKLIRAPLLLPPIFNDSTDSPQKRNAHSHVQTPEYSQDFTPIKSQTEYDCTVLSPSRSYDSALNNIAEPACQTPVKSVSLESSLDQAHQNYSGMSPFTSKKKSKKLSGSFEKMFNLFTPRRSTKSCKDDPKKTKAQHNVSLTTKYNPEEVLEQIKKTIEGKQMKYEQYGWTIRVVMADDWGKLHLSFDLEICQHAKSEAVAVRRKRVKGDSWHYKKYCEDILAVL